MNVSLTPELESFIQGKVSTGLYYSASEVVREAGLDSGDATPLDMQAVKAKARQRKQQKQV
jgi:antitoxin ParD1/3/4